jgi:hypothetical protein
MVALLSIRLILSAIGIWRIRRAYLDIPFVLQRRAVVLAGRLRLRCDPVVVASHQVCEAMVVGFLRPVVLLPAAWLTQLKPEILEAVIAHELAHIRRWDTWVNACQRVVETLWFYHPAVWCVSRQVRLEREKCCDELAVGATGRREQYAVALETVAQRRIASSGPALASMMRGGKMVLLDRIRYVTGSHAEHDRVPWWPVGLLTLIVATAVWMTSTSSAQLDSPVPANSRQEDSNRDSPIPTRPARDPLNDVRQLPQSIAISGTCVDENKVPLINAHLRLFALEFSHIGEVSQRQLQTVRTGDDGHFRFKDVSIERAKMGNVALQVIAQSPGKATVGRSLSIPDSVGDQTMGFTLPAAAAMKGRVTSDDGKAVAGAVVSVGGDLLEPVPGIRAAVTDADGRYEIPDLQTFDLAKQELQPTGNGFYDVSSARFAEVRHPEFARQGFKYTRIPSNVDVTIHRAAVVEGQIVLAEDNQPAVGVRVEFRNKTIRPDYWTRTTTDERGGYRLTTLPPGTYRFSARLNGRANLFRQGVLLESGTNTLDLRMARGGVVKGRVIDISTGQPVVLGKNESMDISPHDRRGISYMGMASARIDSKGAFTLRLPAGRHYLGMYLGPNWRGVNTDALSRNGIEIAEGQTVDLEIRVKPRTPGDDQPPKPLSPKQAVIVAEQAATAAIKQLGGWVETEKIDGQEHVVAVNMVYHEDDLHGRQENRLMSDECLSYVRKFSKLRKLLLTREQATDRALANLPGMTSLETVMIWDAYAVTDTGAAHLATLPNLKTIHIGNSQLTDESLRHFKRLPGLERLSLQGNHFTDTGMAHIKAMTQLKELVLGLGNSEITDEGLRHVSRLVNLERLGLQQSKVTDAGLVHLRDLKELRQLWLNGTAVTASGLDELRKSLPNLEDHRSRR